MSFLKKLKSMINSSINVGNEVTTQVYRKTKKPFRQYMAPERAEKVLEEQQKVPRRAPMNVPKIEFPDEKIVASKEAVKKLLEKSDELIKNVDRMRIVSHDSTENIEKFSKPKPQLRTTQTVLSTDTPRGLITLRDIVDTLHNNHVDPSEWTAEEIAERFKLRLSDTEDMLNYFTLIKPEDKVS